MAFPTVDWTITLGGIISAVGFTAIAIYRFVGNHLTHLQDEMNMRFDKVDKDIRELRQIVFRRKAL